MRSRMAVLTAFALLMCGCGTPPVAEEPESPTAAFESAPCPQFAPMPETTLGPEFSCGFLVVPESRDRPDGRTIRIAVARAKAQSAAPKPDPLVYLTGGPGGPGLLLGNGLATVGLNRDRDLIVVDQRGTLFSQPTLTCPEVDEFLEAAWEMPTQAPGTAEKDLAAVRACRDRLAGQGIDLSAFNTRENAADIADLRTALGIEEWNVYGVSYGSDLALQLLRDHPEGIRSIAVDSVVPPQTNLVEQMWPSAAEGLDALFTACAEQPACAAAHPRLRDEFTATVRRLAKEPAVIEVPGTAEVPPRRVVVDGYAMANLVIQATLDTRKIPGLPKVIHAFATDDHATLAAGVLAPAPAVPGLVAYGLTYGVFCREGAAFTDTAGILATAQQALPELPSEVLSLVPQIPRVVAECGVWDVGRADDSVHDPAGADIPAVLFAGTLDAVTPPSQADLAAQRFPNGRVVRIAGSGHDVLSKSTCAQQILIDFLDDPTGYDVTCAGELRTPAFTT